MSYQNIKLVLAAAESRSLGVYGRYFRVLANTNASFNPQVRIGNNPAQDVPSGVGIDLFDGADPASPNNTFVNLTITNPDPSNPMTVTIATSNGHVDDNRFAVSTTLNTKDANSDAMKTDLDAINTATAASKTDLDAIKTDLDTISTTETVIKNNTRSLNGDTGTQVLASGTANNSTVTLRTVTAGKTLYLTSLSILAGLGGHSSSCIITDGADATQYTILPGGSVVGTGNLAFPLVFSNPVKIPAGWKVKVTTNNASDYMSAFLVGWEE